MRAVVQRVKSARCTVNGAVTGEIGVGLLVFVGVGVGLIVRQGGSSGGDDALALVIHKLTGWRLSRAYLFTDLTVLFASLSYIPFRRIAYSLVTVTVSSLLIDYIKDFRTKTNV